MSQIDWPEGLDKLFVDRIIDVAIAEDLGRGDLTSQAVIPPGTRFTGVIAAREEMVCAGLPVAGRLFERFSPDIGWQPQVGDGDKVPA